MEKKILLPTFFYEHYSLRFQSYFLYSITPNPNVPELSSTGRFFLRVPRTLIVD
jgi:hypothetical protein